MSLTPIKNTLSWRFGLSKVLGSQQGLSFLKLGKAKLVQAGSRVEKRARRIHNTVSEIRTQLTPQFAKSLSGAVGFAGRQAETAKAPGYTVVEIMLVLAVSGALVASALAIFRGTGQKTQFEQSINDFSSKLQSSVQGISNELFPETSQYRCIPGPKLEIANNTQQSTSLDCVFLGKIFTVAKDSNTMSIYTVLGNRLCNGIPPASCQAGQVAATFIDTYPTPAVTALTTQELKETYTMSDANAKLVTAYSNGGSTETDYAGFYNGIGTDAQASAQSGSLNLLSRGYQYPFSTDALGHDPLLKCIRADLDPVAKCIFPNQTQELQSWKLCFANDNNATLKASVTLTITANAAQSVVKMRDSSC